MSATLIDGKKISTQLYEDLTEEVKQLSAKGIYPGLAVVLVGEDPASKIYVNTKVKKCESLGIRSIQHRLPAETTQQELIDLIQKLNKDPEVHGILVQSPPPKHIDEQAVVEAINPIKDVDCFHPENVGLLLMGKKDAFAPCTPAGVMVLLEKNGINPAGKHAVIVGRSNIVGKPMMALLMQKGKGADATVTVCHSRTPNLAYYTKQADIVVAAIGKPEVITGDMLKPGAIVVDVGINRVEDSCSPKGYRVVGDVHFDSACQIASYITPVPGGVGPMTIAMLMKNTIKACRLQNGL